jgi:hypothetical protein
MNTRLKNNISSLYKIFEKYPSNIKMNGSPLYGEKLIEWNKELLSKPLNELTETDLSRFTGKVITTWGDIDDFKHFLPRIFELTAELKTPYEVWITFDKLTLAEWTSWDIAEQQVVQEFMLALWENLLNDGSVKAECEFQNYFSALANFYPKFIDLITIWSNLNSKSSIKHLSNLLINEQHSLFDRNKISGFYSKMENAEELKSWLLSDTILNLLQNKYFEYEKENFAQKISWAEKIITNERQNRI